MAAVSFNIDVPSASLLAGNVGFLTGFEHIESVTVGAAGASSVTFSGIPQYYRHLELRWVWRTTEAATITGAPGVQANGIGGTSYSSHYLLGDGSSASSFAFTSQTHVFGFRTAGSSAASNIFGGGVMQILDYASGVKNKTFRSLNGVDLNGSGSLMFNSGAFLNTSAITSVTFDPRSGNIAQHSTFSLYGIR